MNFIKRLRFKRAMRLAEKNGYINAYGFRFSNTHPRMTEGLRKALLKTTYEASEVDLIRRYVTPADRVLELGICVGATSLVLSGVVGANGLRLYEADPRNFDLAQENFRLNGLSLSIRNRILISGPDRPETIVFYSTENPSSSSTYLRDGKSRQFEVETESFETVLEEYAPTVLCADIEGGEVDLVCNSQGFGRLRTILLETHARVTGQEAVDRMYTRLRAEGFRSEGSSNDGFAVFVRDA